VTGRDSKEVPAAFVAEALTVYLLPLVSPVKSQKPGATVTVHVLAGIEDISEYALTVYDSGVPPPVPDTTDTLTLPAPATCVEIAGVAGAPGPAAGVNAASFEGKPDPAALLAMALVVYRLPLVRPVTSQDPRVPVTVHVPEFPV
jgi:hypothetical protein